MTEQNVLVVRRSSLVAEWVTEWPRSDRLAALSAIARWMPRAEAERSEEWVQPIPCAVLKDRNGRYCIFRRKTDTSRGLQRKLSLLVGGHVDSTPGQINLETLLLDSLRRELLEEVGLTAWIAAHPLAVVADLSSVEASRHVAFVSAVEIESPLDLKVMALEEFAARSKFNLQFLTPTELGNMARQFDPWSAIVVNRLLLPTEHVALPFQGGLFSLDPAARYEG